MREIVLDTETTGLRANQTDRLVEIGCVEMVNRYVTGKTFHVYINPERDMPAEAFAVHGLSQEFLADKPLFREIAQDFLAFIGESPLVIHNADFDMGFINMELKRINLPIIPSDQVVDTLMLARRKHPGGSNRLDDLCNRYGIDNSRRTKHGALLDSELLAEVYIELVGGRQASMMLSNTPQISRTQANRSAQQRPTALAGRLTEAEKQAHHKFIEGLGKTKPLWNMYIKKESESG